MVLLNKLRAMHQIHYLLILSHTQKKPDLSLTGLIRRQIPVILVSGSLQSVAGNPISPRKTAERASLSRRL